MTHQIKKCRHGTVVSQCRCPGPKHELLVPCPDSCPWDAPSDVSSLNDAMRKLQERSLQLALLEANLHGERNPRHSVSSNYPYYCVCGWRGRQFPKDEVRR